MGLFMRFPTLCLSPFIRTELLYCLLIAKHIESLQLSCNKKSFLGCVCVGGAEALFSGKCSLILEPPSAEDHCGVHCLLPCPLGRELLRHWDHKKEQGGGSPGDSPPLPTTVHASLLCRRPKLKLGFSTWLLPFYMHVSLSLLSSFFLIE